jgi:hypothetical protein
MAVAVLGFEEPTPARGVAQAGAVSPRSAGPAGDPGGGPLKAILRAR